MSNTVISPGFKVGDFQIVSIKTDRGVKLGVWRTKEAPVVKPPVVITDPDLLERMREDALIAERRAPFLRKLQRDLAP